MLILTVVLAAATPIITKRAVQQVKTSSSTSGDSSKGPFYGKCGYGTLTVASTDIVKTVDLVDGDALDVDNLKAGTTLSVRFKTANSAVSPQLGIKTKTYDIYDESGNQVGTVNNPAYFPADAVIEFTFDGTNWYYHKKVVINNVDNTAKTWYRIYSDGWIEQGLQLTCAATTLQTFKFKFPKDFKSTNYTPNALVISNDLTNARDFWQENQGSRTVNSISINSGVFNGYANELIGMSLTVAGY